MIIVARLAPATKAMSASLMMKQHHSESMTPPFNSSSSRSLMNFRRSCSAMGCPSPKQIIHCRPRWVEQPDDDPRGRKLVNRPNVKVCVVSVDHFIFVSLAKFRLPGRAVLPSPISVRLAHLPIRAEHLMALTPGVSTTKIIPEIEGDFFKRLSWTALEQQRLLQSR